MESNKRKPWIQTNTNIMGGCRETKGNHGFKQTQTLWEAVEKQKETMDSNKHKHGRLSRNAS